MNETTSAKNEAAACWESEVIRNSEKLYEGDLVYYYGIFWNSEGLSNPYHGYKHTKDVVRKAYDALGFYRNPSSGQLIDPRKARSLMIASLMHDIDHCGKKGDDGCNIKRAIEKLNSCILKQDRSSAHEICAIITTTEYMGGAGHVHAIGSLVPGVENLERIMRDADMTQAFSDDWEELVIHGLGKEIGLTADAMLRSQIPFLKKLKLWSDWGAHTYSKEVFELKIKECEEKIAILDEGLESLR